MMPHLTNMLRRAWEWRHSNPDIEVVSTGEISHAFFLEIIARLDKLEALIADKYRK